MGAIHLIRTVTTAFVIALMSTVIVGPAHASSQESGSTQVEGVLACHPAATPYVVSGPGTNCPMQPPSPQAVDQSGRLLFCDTHDQPISLMTRIDGRISTGPAPVNVGQVSYGITSAGGERVFSTTVGIAPGQYTGSGHPALVTLPKLKAGTYRIEVTYLGGSQMHGHAHPPLGDHQVLIQWQPSSRVGTLTIAECGDMPKVTKVSGKKPSYRATVASCAEGIAYEWTFTYGTGVRAAPLKGCSATFDAALAGKPLARVAVTRTSHPGRWTVREVAIGKGQDDGQPQDEGKPPPGGQKPEECSRTGAIPQNIADLDWSIWSDAFKRRVKGKLFEQWRQGHPAGTPGGSPEAFRAFAGLVDSFLENGDGQSIELQAAWQALVQSDSELKALGPILWETTTCSLSGASVTQGLRTSVAIAAEVFEAARAASQAGGQIVTGIFVGAQMLYDRPQAFFDTLTLFTQMARDRGPEQLVLMATDAGIELTVAQAKLFMTRMEEVNTAALAGEDEKIADIFASLAGQAIFDEVFALGTVKAAQAGIKGAKGLSAKARRTLGEATDDIQDDLVKARKAKEGGSEISVREMQELGLDDFRGQQINAISQETGTLIEVRPGNGRGLDMVVNGDAHLKPEGLAGANSANAADLQLGIPEQAEGLSYWGPVKEPPVDAPEEVWARWRDRSKAYDPKTPEGAKNHALMDWLQQDPATRGGPPAGIDPEKGFRWEYGKKVPMHVKVDGNGIVRDAVTGKPFGPDPDIAAIRDAKTGKLASPEVVDLVTQKLRSIGIQHGATAHWTQGSTELRRKLLQQHSLGGGGGPLLRFGGRGNDALPVRSFADWRESEAWVKAHPDYKSF